MFGNERRRLQLVVRRVRLDVGFALPSSTTNNITLLFCRYRNAVVVVFAGFLVDKLGNAGAPKFCCVNYTCTYIPVLACTCNMRYFFSGSHRLFTAHLSWSRHICTWSIPSRKRRHLASDVVRQTAVRSWQRIALQ